SSCRRATSTPPRRRDRSPRSSGCSRATGARSPARSPRSRSTRSPSRWSSSCAARPLHERCRSPASRAPAAPGSPGPPTSRRRGGALLGDRIRMNAIDADSVFFRSLATRTPGSGLPERLDDVIAAAKAWGAGLVVVETPGIGQGDADVVDHVDVPVYVMTPEFGAAMQLEKIDMIDLAHAVVVNKYDRAGAPDALRHVRRQVARSRQAWTTPHQELPVFGTVASRFNDDGVTGLWTFLREELEGHGLDTSGARLGEAGTRVSTQVSPLIPAARVQHLAETAATVRAYHRRTAEQAEAVRRAQHLRRSEERRV